MLNYVLAPLSTLVPGRLLLRQCHLTTTRHRRRRAPARVIRGRCRPTTMSRRIYAKRRAADSEAELRALPQSTDGEADEPRTLGLARLTAELLSDAALSYGEPTC